VPDTDADPARGGGQAERLVGVSLDKSLTDAASADVAHERDVAIYDLLSYNSFSIAGRKGPFHLHLAIIEKRLVFDVGGEDTDERATFMLSLSPFRRIVRDYFAICESYYDAIRTAPPSRIEAIDMGRRGLHDEGSKVLQERLAGKVEMDFRTARRLFTLICALHWRS
jgi:uncharacterized protein (UPF0262 family)